MDYRLALMCGTEIPVPDCQIVVHQPTIKEIALIGEKDFFAGAYCLCVNKNLVTQDETVLENTNNFQIFMTIMSQKETRDKKIATMQLLSLLFPQFKIILTPQSILLNSEENRVVIDENNFDILQDIIREVCCLKTGGGSDSYNPGNSKAQEIADKLMRGRQRIAAEKGGENGSVLVQYVSSLTIGLSSMSLEDCMNLTLYQLYDLVQRYSLWVNWDLDIKTRLAGGKPETQPDNWMKNIH